MLYFYCLRMKILLFTSESSTLISRKQYFWNFRCSYRNFLLDSSLRDRISTPPLQRHGERSRRFRRQSSPPKATGEREGDDGPSPTAHILLGAWGGEPTRGAARTRSPQGVDPPRSRRIARHSGFGRRWRRHGGSRIGARSVSAGGHKAEAARPPFDGPDGRWLQLGLRPLDYVATRAPLSVHPSQPTSRHLLSLLPPSSFLPSSFSHLVV